MCSCYRQEVGNCPQATGTVTVQDHSLGGQGYTLYLVSAPEAHRCQAVLVRASLGFHASKKITLPAGMLLLGARGNQRMHVACLHLPHSKRLPTAGRPLSGAEECWKATLEQFDQALSETSPQDWVFLGMDLNQDPHAVTDSFVGMGLFRALTAKHALDLHKPVGPTWGARGYESEIDAVFVRVPRIRMQAHKRADMKEALPSDHSPVFCLLVSPAPLLVRGKRPRTRCGRWLPDTSRIEEYAASGSPFCMDEFVTLCTKSRRMPSLRYKDSESIKALIALRRETRDPSQRACMLKQIREQRSEAKAAHQLDILDRAKAGDRQAISYLRRSASQRTFETSYIEQQGGQRQASADLARFYETKYTSTLPPPTKEAVDRMLESHMSVQPKPFDEDELTQALMRCKRHTSAGMDGVCYEAVLTYHKKDGEGRLLEFFHKLLFRKIPLPASWHESKVVLLPKVASPEGPGDLRPICLSPCMSKIFGRLVMTRVARHCPPYVGGANGLPTPHPDRRRNPSCSNDCRHNEAQERGRCTHRQVRHQGGV